MRINHKIGCALLVSVLMGVVSIGCGNKGGESDERVYASVNGKTLTESEIRDLVPADIFDKLSTENRRDLVREWVEQELMYQEALEKGIENEPDIARILERVQRDLLVAEFLERTLAEENAPPDTTLKAYYKEHPDYFIRQSDEYQVRFALFDTSEDAQDFFNRVKRGASFSELAQEYSKDPSAENGGDLGIVSEQSVQPGVWDSIVITYGSAGTGRISSPFEVIDGYGIVIVDAVYKSGTTRTFEESREQVIDYYRMEQREAAKEALIRRLEGKADIKYNL